MQYFFFTLMVLQILEWTDLNGHQPIVKKALGLLEILSSLLEILS